MTKHKALKIINEMINNLIKSSSNGEELDWALEQSEHTRKDLNEALIFLSWLEDEDRMGR